MSLRIIKAGILDTIQDTGRYGFQYLGINPNGAMDPFSSQLCNALLGNELSTPVIEFHFPAAQIAFEKETILAICGADFQATINNQEIPMDHPVWVARNTILQFKSMKRGARAYLSVLNSFYADNWLGSCSTNLRTGMKGWLGKALSTGDILETEALPLSTPMQEHKDFFILPWKTNEAVQPRNEIEFIIGSEWYELTREAQENFQSHWFQLTSQSDRMGYRLHGPALQVKEEESLVSSAVSFGTIQLLPDGQLIILMADHQTTGGYPRIAHVISAHFPILAQKKPADVMQFRITDLASAEEKKMRQQKFLKEIQNACKFRMGKFLQGHN